MSIGSETPNQAQVNADDSCATVNSWRAQIASTFAWIEKHPFSLATAGFALSVISINHYLRREGIPLSILSSDTIAAVPAVLAMVSVTAFALLMLLLLPLAAVFDGIIQERDGTLRLLPTHSPFRKKKIILWLTALAAPGMLVMLVIIGIAYELINERFGIPFGIFLGISVFWLAWRVARRRSSGTFNAIERTMFALLAGVVQILTSILFVQLALKFLPAIENQSVEALIVIGACMAVMAALALVQLAIVRSVEIFSKGGQLVRYVPAFVGGIIVTLCVMPYSGSVLAGTVISHSASGGHRCVQFTVSGDPADFNELMQMKDKERTRTTKPVRVLAGTSSLHYLRLVDGADGVLMLPVDRVTGLKPCPGKN